MNITSAQYIKDTVSNKINVIKATIDGTEMFVLLATLKHFTKHFLSTNS